MIKAGIPILFFIFFAPFTAFCSSSRTHSAQAPKLLWSKNLKSLMGEVAVTKKGNAVFVATSPDSETEGGPKTHDLHRFSVDGELQWRKETTARIRNLSVSDDGALVVYSTNAEKVRALDRKGRTLWEFEGVCKPVVLSRAKKVLCYHDDDSEPGVAFDIFSWRGKKLLSHSISDDILALKVSEDERNLVIGLTGGKMVLFGPKYRKVWNAAVNGEILDLAVSSGKDPILTALFESHGKDGKVTQRLGAFRKGRLFAQGAVPGHSEQIEISQDGKAAVAYGDGLKGQYLGGFLLPAEKGILSQSWKQDDSRPADFSSTAAIVRDLVLLGYQDSSGPRQNHILAMSLDGKPEWNVPLDAEEGAYLFGYAFSARGAVLAAVTDDGKVSVYRIRAP